MNRFVQFVVVCCSCHAHLAAMSMVLKSRHLFRGAAPATAGEASSVPVRKAPDVPSGSARGLARQGLITATRTTCMRPCAVQFDAQRGASLTWQEVRDSEFLWDFDDGGSTRDSEGFLAAVVYETAGTYHPTVTVDGSRGTHRRSGSPIQSKLGVSLLPVFGQGAPRVPRITPALSLLYRVLPPLRTYSSGAAKTSAPRIWVDTPTSPSARSATETSLYLRLELHGLAQSSKPGWTSKSALPDR